MALLLPNSAFIHIPRTGGTWTRTVLNEGLGYRKKESGERWSVKEIHHTYVMAKPWIKDKFTWAYVRNPLTYLQSRWAGTNYPPVFQVRQNAGLPYYDISKSEDFCEFIEHYLEYCPGSVGRLFKRYISDEDKFPAVDYIGKTETLADDLINVLEIAGETYDEDIIRNFAPRHAKARKPEWADKIKYTPALRDAVVEAEKSTFELFGFDPDIDVI